MQSAFKGGLMQFVTMTSEALRFLEIKEHLATGFDIEYYMPHPLTIRHKALTRNWGKISNAIWDNKEAVSFDCDGEKITFNRDVLPRIITLINTKKRDPGLLYGLRKSPRDSKKRHPFIGTYSGAVSTAYLFAGPIFNDYSSVGYSLLLKKEKAIILQPDRVVIANGPTFGCVLMKDFLQALAKRLKCNTAAYENCHMIYVPEGHPLKCAPKEPLRVNVLFQYVRKMLSGDTTVIAETGDSWFNRHKEPLRVNVLFQHVQKMLSGDTTVIAETGDSWFNCQKLKLPKGCGYEIQMQYGSIGWSVGAHFIGTYWGAVSTAFCAGIVESTDAYLFGGPIFNDYRSVGYSLLLKQEKAIILQTDRVVIENGPTFGCVLMKDFLQALAKRLKCNTTAYENYYRIYVPEGNPLKCAPKEPLRVSVQFQHVQKMSGDTAVITETGDSWFNCQKLKLPKGRGYELQMQYGSIGWSGDAHFNGTYWDAVSTAFCAEIVELADAYLFAGPIFNDYSSVGYSLLLKKEKAIILQPDRVVIANGPTFGCVQLKDFLEALAKRLKCNTTAYENYHRIYVPEGRPLKCALKEPLRVNVLFQHIQKMLSGDTAVIAETGDSWFNCQKLKLPKGCGYEFQMQYGSIGWSVGATLGYAQPAKDKRVIACIGDGSFQVTAQDVSTMLRCSQNPFPYEKRMFSRERIYSASRQLMRVIRVLRK